MCDYSLQGIQNRLAAEGETLIVHQFRTGSKGLTAPEYIKPAGRPKGLFATLHWIFAGCPSECAVCIPDGARLRLSDISPGLRLTYGLHVTEEVYFRQLSADVATYRDAVEFKNGVKVRLQDLNAGQSVQVLTLASEETEATLGFAYSR